MVKDVRWRADQRWRWSPRRYFDEIHRDFRWSREDRLFANAQARWHLLLHLGLWKGQGDCPARFEEAQLEAAERRLKVLLNCSSERLRTSGVAWLEFCLPLLQFLSGIVSDVILAEGAGLPYGKQLRKRYHGYMKALLCAPIPPLPKRERQVIQGLYARYKEAYQTFRAITPSMRAANSDSVRQQVFQRALPEMSTGSVRLLVKRCAAFRVGGQTRRGRGRNMSPHELTVELLASEEGVDPHTIRDALRLPRLRERTADSWGRKLAHGIPVKIISATSPRAPQTSAPAAAHVQYLRAVLDRPALVRKHIRKIRGRF